MIFFHLRKSNELDSDVNEVLHTSEKENKIAFCEIMYEDKAIIVVKFFTEKLYSDITLYKKNLKK